MSNSNRLARQDRNRLRAFAQDVADVWLEGAELEHPALESLLLKHELLVPKRVYQCCAPDLCSCKELGTFPTTCLRPTSLLTGDRNDSAPESR